MHPPYCPCRDCSNEDYARRRDSNDTHTPDVDYAYGAREALQAVPTAVGKRREEGEQDLRQVANDVRRIADEMGVAL